MFWGNSRAGLGPAAAVDWVADQVQNHLCFCSSQDCNILYVQFCDFFRWLNHPLKYLLFSHFELQNSHVLPVVLHFVFLPGPKELLPKTTLYQWGHQGGWWWQNKGGREGQLCYSYLDFQRNIEHRCARPKQGWERERESMESISHSPRLQRYVHCRTGTGTGTAALHIQDKRNVYTHDDWEWCVLNFQWHQLEIRSKWLSIPSIEMKWKWKE